MRTKRATEEKRKAVDAWVVGRLSKAGGRVSYNSLDSFLDKTGGDFCGWQDVDGAGCDDMRGIHALGARVEFRVGELYEGGPRKLLSAWYEEWKRLGKPMKRCPSGWYRPAELAWAEDE